ncbi:MAG: hemolysin family protein [Kiritimatiellae bacterium]|nr:hemolysin family protein [Kiritimatiellia bacterium]
MMWAVDIVLFIALLAASAFNSSAETLFFSLDPLHVRRIVSARPSIERGLRELLAEPRRLLSSVLILNVLVNIAASAVFYRMMRRVWPESAEALSIVAMTAILLVFGEFGPKQAAMVLGPRLVPAYIGPVRWAISLAAPLRAALEWATARVEPWLRPDRPGLTGAEFRSLVEISQQQGVLDEEEFSLIKAIISLETMTAADAMTPRVDLKGINLDDPAQDPVAVARASRRHFLPLFRGTLDQIEGLLDVRRFLLDPAHSLEAARLPPMYVPENLRLNRLLADFQSSGRRVAVVVDEFGGTSGLITRGDILERITGEIYQEMSRPRPVFQEAGPNRWLVDATLSLEDLNRKLGVQLSADGADRLAGWVSAHAGHLPQPNEVVEAQGVRVTVLQAERRRVTLAHIEKLPESSGSGESAR